MTSTDDLQAALQHAQAQAARLALLQQHSDEVSWIVDICHAGAASPASPASPGYLSYLSPAAERQFGYTQATAQALANQLLHDLPARLARLADGDLGRLHLRRESEQPHRDGHLVPVEIESTLVLDADGTPRLLLGVVRDLSARRELAAQQKKFASMLSHEFRTPLATIDGAVQRLEMTGTHHDEPTRKRYRKIQTAVDRLLEMLGEYLSPERMAAIGRQREPNEVSPAALLMSVAVQGRERRPAILVHNKGLPQWMRCDPNGMRLCLDILLDNAIKYTPSDSKIELLGSAAPEGGIELLVRDQGAGIAAAEQAHIFEKSYRGSNAAGVPGSGLGLYMARAIIDVHGGTLTMRNVSESGTEFRIWLPIAAAPGKNLARAGGSSDNSLDASRQY